MAAGVRPAAKVTQKLFAGLQDEKFKKPVPQNRPAKTETPQKSRTAKKHQSVPQKIEAVPQNDDSDLFDEFDDDFDEIEDFAGNADWRVEKRFYTKKDGTVMLYWNYRSRKPLYIKNGRKVGYKKGGKKIWQQK